MIREDSLPEVAAAWQTAARDLASRDKIQIGIADEGGTRTQADTTRILGYRDQDYALYAAAEAKAGRTPQAKTVWRPINQYGTSFHNFGGARDGKIVSRPAGMSYDEAVKRVRAAMVRAGLRGISSVNDQLHFELPISLAEAAQRWKEYTTKTGRYSPPVVGLPGGDLSRADDDDAGTDTESDDSSSDIDTPRTGASALVVLLVVVVLGGGGYILYRRFGG